MAAVSAGLMLTGCGPITGTCTPDTANSHKIIVDLTNSSLVSAQTAHSVRLNMLSGKNQVSRNIPVKPPVSIPKDSSTSVVVRIKVKNVESCTVASVQ